MQPSASPLPRHLASLQYVRAIAAIAVVFYHAAIQVALGAGYRIFPLVGASGVDVFFVLSGFVMWASTMGKDVPIRDFLLRRAIRIIPLYWILTLAAATVALLAPALLKSTTFSIPHLAASLAFFPWVNPAPHIFAGDRITPVIIPGWTLNLEMVFYLLFAVCLLTPQRIRPLALSFAICALFCVGSLASVYESPLAFYGNDMVFEFLAGVLIAAYLVPIRTAPPRIAWLALTTATTALLVSDWAGLMMPRLVQFGIPAAAIIASVISLEKAGAVRRLPLLERLGDASYSIYLSHIFVLAAVRVVFRALGLGTDNIAAFAYVAVGVVASTFLGDVLHRLVEKPLVNTINTWARGRRPPPDQAIIH